MKRRTHKELGRVLSVSVMNVFAKRPRAVLLMRSYRACNQNGDLHAALRRGHDR